MPKYRPLAPATPARPRTSPHRTHVTWDPSCETCTAEMLARSARMVAQREQATARTMRTAPGYAR